MADTSLLEYLQHSLPEIPLDLPENITGNTRNNDYSFSDIRILNRWEDFNWQTINQRYGALLQETTIQPWFVEGTPLPAVESESSLAQVLLHCLDLRLNRAHREGFDEYIRMNNGMGSLSRVEYRHGDRANVIRQFKPDKCFVEMGLPRGARPNRCPGDIKPSWKWDPELRLSRAPTDQKEYKQALSQVNWYMKQHRARYGFIVTDNKLLVFRRRDNYGNLDLADPIEFSTQGNVQRPRMTVLLALWYLGMLAAENGNGHNVPWHM